MGFSLIHTFERASTAGDLPGLSWSAIGQVVERGVLQTLSGHFLELGMADKKESAMEEPAVKEVAARHGKSTAQVLLRWGVQRDTCVVPKTTRVERLRENIEIFDFMLTDDEMSAINALNRNRRFNDPGVFAEQAFNAFLPIYD